MRARLPFLLFLFAKQDHVDYMSLQALLFQHKRLSLYRQTRLFFSFQKRMSD
jgi:hypothetical protein